jgi:hypothetical protein
MCCLSFENDQYRELRSQMPRVGIQVGTPNGVGKVNKLNLLAQRVEIIFPDDDNPVWIPLDQLTPLRPDDFVCCHAAALAGTSAEEDDMLDSIRPNVPDTLLDATEIPAPPPVKTNYPPPSSERNRPPRHGKRPPAGPPPQGSPPAQGSAGQRQRPRPNNQPNRNRQGGNQPLQAGGNAPSQPPEKPRSQGRFRPRRRKPGPPQQ